MKSLFTHDQESVPSDSQINTEAQETVVIEKELSKLEIKEETEGAQIRWERKRIRRREKEGWRQKHVGEEKRKERKKNLLN